jgi:CRP/FNR family cyclic AMP-dependent transcriptional regulator
LRLNDLNDVCCAKSDSAQSLSAQSSGMGENLDRIDATTAGRPFDPAAFAAKYGGVVGSRYEAKHKLYSQGDAADCIYYLQKGQAQIRVISKEGKEAVLAVVEAGDFFGEGCLVGEPLRMSAVVTMTESLVSRLEKASVIRAIHDDSAFSEFFLMYVLNRTVRLTDDLIDHLFNSSEKRLARILLLLANYGKEGRVETVINKIDHQTLAQMVGTTRSRVNFFMNKFRKLGYIDYNDRISVHSSLLNVVLLDQPGRPGDPEQPEI